MPQPDGISKPKGMDRALASKLLHRYDAATEADVLAWIKEMTGEVVEPGSLNVERALKTGKILVKLIDEVYKRIPQLPAACANVKIKVNAGESHFKSMENIEIFLTACAALGLDESSRFPTADLFEGKNMVTVVGCIHHLGTQCQLLNMNGPKCGPPRSMAEKKNFTQEQLRASEGIIGLQAGTNKFASQKGYKMGATRHISDYKVEKMCNEGQGLIGLQAGTNKFASQKGMKMGAVRHIADIRADDMCKEGNTEIGLQAGTNKFASQKGMSMGAVRHIADIRADDMSKEGQTEIGLQAGTNKFASQKGMCMGAVRHVADIRADDMSSEGQGVIGLQSGTNKFASQKGMKMGALRHVSDYKVEDMNKDSSKEIGLQAGTNKFASQKGMSSMGAQRHIADIRAEDVSREGSATIGLQMGSNRGASQTGMTFGSQRHVADMPITRMGEQSDPNVRIQQKAAAIGKGLAPAGISYVSAELARPMDALPQNMASAHNQYQAPVQEPEPVQYNAYNADDGEVNNGVDYGQEEGVDM